MCKTIKNTRWLCYATRGCRPRNKYNPSHELRPTPFVSTCDKVDAFTRACYGRHEVDNSRDEASIFYKTLECPRHHRRRMANLQEAWDVEFQKQIIEARPGKAHRKAAEARKEQMDRQREAFLKTLEQEAEGYNAEFYGEALAWQGKAVAQVAGELVGDLI